MIFLSLPDARILHIKGWGSQASPSTRFRVELAPQGKIMVYRKTVLGEKPALLPGIAPLLLQTWTDTIRTGGGFIGGGFGVEGAAKGILEASVLNALTGRRREYALLGAFTFAPDGSRREIVFGFRSLSESDLRQKLAEAVPKWAEDFIQETLKTIAQIAAPEQIAVAYAEIDGMQTRGMLTNEQHARLEAELAKRGPRPTTPSTHAAPTDRATQLKTLAELKDSGALNEAEFQAEKARVLDS